MNPAVIIGVAAAFTFYAMGEYESKGRASRLRAPVWALVSAIVTYLAITGFDAGVVAVLLAQLGLFVSIGVVRALRDD
jgi:hypothetical protein